MVLSTNEFCRYIWSLVHSWVCKNTLGLLVPPSWFRKKPFIYSIWGSLREVSSHLSDSESFVMQIILLLSSYQQLNLNQDWLTRMFANQFETKLGWGPMEVCQNLPSKDKVHSWSHFGNALTYYLIILVHFIILYGPVLRLQ